MKVCEIFPAIQGEGPMMGQPATFLRLSGCNLKCSFCDSQYHNDGTEMTVNAVAKEIQKHNINYVVITGGEPTLQEDELYSLKKLLPKQFVLALETNGTNIINKNIFRHIIVSPKKNKINKIAIKCNDSKPRVEYKFVYEDGNDLWWEDVINSCNISKDKVWIMPEGSTRDQQIKKMPEVVEYCIKNKYKFSPRLHVLAFDNKRGV